MKYRAVFTMLQLHLKKTVHPNPFSERRTNQLINSISEKVDSFFDNFDLGFAPTKYYAIDPFSECFCINFTRSEKKYISLMGSTLFYFSFAVIRPTTVSCFFEIANDNYFSNHN